jgi:uncharacterized protein (TIGR00288 family)
MVNEEGFILRDPARATVLDRPATGLSEPGLAKLGSRAERVNLSISKAERERSLAVFIDLENLAIGFQNQRKIKFDIQKVLERLVEKGKLIVKKAYADWSRYPLYTAPFHEAAIELIEIPKRSQTGKNSADIRLVVDAIDLAWSKPHVDTFVIVSGDSDFSPLVSKLKENGKHVIGLGMKGSTSDLLRDNCDEFIYYEDLERQEQNEQQLATDLNSYLPPNLPERQREVFSLFVEACHALRRENHEVLYASMIKDTMKRKKPSFDESYYGYRSFTHLLEDADNLALADIERNPKSGTYVVSRFCGEREAKVTAETDGARALPPASVPLPAGTAPRRDRRPASRRRR